MNPGQQKFQEFILANVDESKAEEAKTLLAEGFAKQDAGTFDEAYQRAFIPRMLPLRRPDRLDAVKAVMQNHKA